MPKRASNILNLSDRVKISYLLKGSMSLVEVGLHYGKKESSIHSIQNKGHEIRSSIQ
jgi:hypothetical protein